jgi:hypothetical protein
MYGIVCYSWKYFVYIFLVFTRKRLFLNQLTKWFISWFVRRRSTFLTLTNRSHPQATNPHYPLHDHTNQCSSRSPLPAPHRSMRSLASPSWKLSSTLSRAFPPLPWSFPQHAINTSFSTHNHESSITRHPTSLLDPAGKALLRAQSSPRFGASMPPAVASVDWAMRTPTQCHELVPPSM